MIAAHKLVPTPDNPCDVWSAFWPRAMSRRRVRRSPKPAGRSLRIQRRQDRDRRRPCHVAVAYSDWWGHGWRLLTGANSTVPGLVEGGLERSRHTGLGPVVSLDKVRQ